MGNCCSKSSESISPSPIQSSPPPMESSVPTSGHLVRPSPTESSLLISTDPERASTSTDPIQSIRGRYEKINPVELIDPLVGFIENQLQKMKTPSEAGSSSSDGWLATVRDGTQDAAMTVDMISTEAEKLSKLDVVKEMGSITLKVLEGMGELHWVFLGLSLVAFAAERYITIGSTADECRNLLLKLLEVAKDVNQYSKQMPEEKEKLCNAITAIVEGAVVCCNYLNRGNFFRFWSATTAAAQLEKTNQKLRDVRHSLSFSAVLQIQKQIQKQSTLRLPQSTHLLDFQPVGIEEQVENVKALLNMEGAQSALAVIVCGFGGVGKSTLAASVLESLDWSSMNFKFCWVVIDEKTPDIIKLQKDIIYDLEGVKVDLRHTDEGRLRIKEALKNKSSLLFIDNVVDKAYMQNLLPKDLSSCVQDLKSDAEKQKTKLRILVTSRDKNVKEELNINCQVHEVHTLYEPACQRLLQEIIMQNKVGEEKDFDEKSMINEVANACRGVPLLLSVFGKHLRGQRNKDSYLEALDVLREGNLQSYGDEDLGSKLMFVYDKIKDMEVKEAFLDICKYFHGWEWNLVADIVDFPKLEDLRNRMLVSKNGSGKVIVHDILRLMGMKEANLTRFSNYNDLSVALGDNLLVKGVSLVNDDGLITIQSTQLEAMQKSLRVLMLGDWVTLDGPPYEKAFTSLRYLRVGDITVFPFKDPSKLDKLRVFLNRSKPGMNLSHVPFSLKRISHEVPHVECDKFVKLDIQNLSSLKSFIVETKRSVELPEELHFPASLVELHLNRCKNIPKDIGHLTALESLNLDRSDFECLPQGFGKLKKLIHFSMDYCSNAVLPDELALLSSMETFSMKGCRNLRALPESLGGLLSLQTLDFSECINLEDLPESLGELRIQSLNLHSLVNLNELPNGFGNMPFLKDLSLSSCHSLMSLPKSFVQLKMLETLNIIDCRKLSVMPEDFGQLRCLKHMTVEKCHLLKELPQGFGALPALKTFTLEECNSFVSLPRDFRELTSLEKLYLKNLPLMSRIPDGFGKLNQLKFLNVFRCQQLKTLSDDFENMAALERLTMRQCPELDGAMMEKILKLQNCYEANISGCRKLLENWEHMKGETEYQIFVYSGDIQREKVSAIRAALLHGKCMEVKNDTHQLMERSSLLVGLEVQEGVSATVALIMLPLQMQSHQHHILQRLVERAREKAKNNGSGKLQIVCARKVDLYAERATPTEEEEREEEEEGIRQILVSLPERSCAIPSSQSKRLKLLTSCCNWFYYRPNELWLWMANVGVDITFTAAEEISEKAVEEISEMVPPPPEIRKPENEHSNSIQNFIECIENSPIGESKTVELMEALKGSGIEYILIHNNTSKVGVDDLHGKAFGLIICDLKFLECIKLQQICKDYKDFQQKDSNFIWIWIPSDKWPTDYGHGSCTRLIQCMQWATIPHPQLVKVEKKYPRFVVLDEHGQIANHDALPLLLGWGVKSYPFTQHTIPESFSLVESESCLEFLLRGMNIVGRKQMKSKMTFLYAEHPKGWLKMKSKVEELIQIHGSFEVLYVGNFDEEKDIDDIENLKGDYENAIRNMSWPSLSLSDMIMFWYRCKYLTNEELMKESNINIMMDTLLGLAKHLYRQQELHCRYRDYTVERARLVLVDKDGAVVTRGGYDVVQMICEPSDGEGMAMRMVKDELKESLNRGECSPLVKTFFRDEIHNLPQHPQHPLLLYPTLKNNWCDVCSKKRIEDDGFRSYRCDECDWDMCGSCWMTNAKQEVELLRSAKDN